MGIIAFLKEGFIHHKATAFKGILSFVAVVVFLFALLAFNTSERLKAQQAAQARSTVTNHTQTLNEIKNAVTQLKASNQADHTVTIKYINCVLVGITQANLSNNQAAILAVYKQCLSNSQIPGTPLN